MLVSSSRFLRMLVVVVTVVVVTVVVVSMPSHSLYSDESESWSSAATDARASSFDFLTCFLPVLEEDILVDFSVVVCVTDDMGVEGGGELGLIRVSTGISDHGCCQTYFSAAVVLSLEAREVSLVMVGGD